MDCVLFRCHVSKHASKEQTPISLSDIAICLSNGPLLPPFLCSPVLQVAHSLQPLPPHCSLRPTRPPRPPPTTPPLARLHRSGNARCPCWRKTPPTLTWSPTRTTHTCSAPSPPPRVRALSPLILIPSNALTHFVYASLSHPSPCVHFLNQI